MSRMNRLAALAALLLLPLSAQAQWTEASTPHFSIYSEGNPEQLRALAENLERVDQAMRRFGRIDDPDISPVNRIRIYLAPRKLDVIQMAGSLMFTTSSAPRAGSLVMVAKLRAGEYPLDNALFHEYAHHVESSYSVPWPTWLSEGHAEFQGAVGVGADGSIEFGRLAEDLLGYLAGDADLNISLSDTVQVARAPSDLSGPQRASVYARGWLLVHYLTFEPSRQGQLVGYLTELKSGKSSLEAAVSAFGDIDKLDREFESYLRRRRLPAMKIPSSELEIGTVTLRSLSPGENAVLPLHVRSKFPMDSKEANKLVQRLRKAAAPFPDDPSVQLALAEAELAAGNHAAAEAAADRALSADSKLVKAHVCKGRARMALAQQARDLTPETWAEVRNWFVTANRMDPEDPEPLILFYQSFAASGQAPTANSVAGLNRALELAPQDRSLRLLGAYQYLADREVPMARRLLSLVASDPHQVELAKSVNAVIAKLDAGDQGGALQLLKDMDIRWK